MTDADSFSDVIEDRKKMISLKFRETFLTWEGTDGENLLKMKESQKTTAGIFTYRGPMKREKPKEDLEAQEKE